MNPSFRNRCVPVAILALGLASCATPRDPDDSVSAAVRAARYQDRLEAISTIRNWGMVGKLAVSTGEDGGSGRLEWNTEPGFSELNFRGTLGQGAWKLAINADSAVLELANGERSEAEDVSTLIYQSIGWEIPVKSLAWWVRGFAAPGAINRRELDAEGRILSLSQGGWTIEYQRYRDVGALSLPGKLEARRDDRFVKFVMREWISEQPPNDS